MLDAEREIIGCITGRAPSGDDIKMTRNIVDAIGKMTAKGVRIKYLLPKFPDRLQIGIEYFKAGAEILFSSCIMVHNLRYSVIDERVVVLGIPDTSAKKRRQKKDIGSLRRSRSGFEKLFYDLRKTDQLERVSSGST